MCEEFDEFDEYGDFGGGVVKQLKKLEQLYELTLSPPKKMKVSLVWDEGTFTSSTIMGPRTIRKVLKELSEHENDELYNWQGIAELELHCLKEAINMANDYRGEPTI